MAALEINPAVWESLFVEDRNGKVKLDEGAFAEAFVESNHLICYNGIVYDQTGQALSSAEGQQAIYRLLRGLNTSHTPATVLSMLPYFQPDEQYISPKQEVKVKWKRKKTRK